MFVSHKYQATSNKFSPYAIQLDDITVSPPLISGVTIDKKSNGTSQCLNTVTTGGQRLVIHLMNHLWHAEGIHSTCLDESNSWTIKKLNANHYRYAHLIDTPLAILHTWYIECTQHTHHAKCSIHKRYCNNYPLSLIPLQKSVTYSQENDKGNRWRGTTSPTSSPWSHISILISNEHCEA